MVFKSLYGDIYSDSDDESVLTAQEIHDNTLDITDLTIYQDYVTYRSDLEQISIQLIEGKRLGIAHQLWPAAKYLCRYIEQHIELVQNYQQIIELGAGIGLCGLFISALLQKKSINSPQVILTDLPEAMEGLRHNISLNALEHIEAMVLRWGEKGDIETIMNAFLLEPSSSATLCHPPPSGPSLSVPPLSDPTLSLLQLAH
jgi:predicted nicotinamide N-methyase